MPKEFVNPNLHVVLIHFPLGLLIAGTLIELFAFLWRRTTFRSAGQWMILLGILSLAPAATAGLYALYDMNVSPATSHDAMPGASWADIRHASTIKGASWDTMKEHVWLTASASAGLLVLVVLWLGCSDLWRARLHLFFLLLLLLGVGTLLGGAQHGGEMVYDHGIGVEWSGQTSAVLAEPSHDITFYAPPLEAHAILAGAAVAMAMAAIGISLRAGVQARAAREARAVNEIGAALNPNARPLVPGMGIYEATPPPRAPILRQPVARFWLLGVLLAICTALSGWWTLAHASDSWNIPDLWKMVVDPNAVAAGAISRRLAHALAGGTIVVLMLLLALVCRVAVGRRVIISLLSMLLIVFVATQIWFGSLLMFDSNEGTLGKFNPATPIAGETPPPSTSSTEPTTTPATTQPVVD